MEKNIPFYLLLGSLYIGLVNIFNINNAGNVFSVIITATVYVLWIVATYLLIKDSSNPVRSCLKLTLVIVGLIVIQAIFLGFMWRITDTISELQDLGISTGDEVDRLWKLWTLTRFPYLIMETPILGLYIFNWLGIGAYQLVPLGYGFFIIAIWLIYLLWFLSSKE